MDHPAKTHGNMPEPRRLDLALLPSGRSETFYLARFMEEFGECPGGTAIFDAPSGHRLAVSRQVFTNHLTGRTKIDKEGRAPFVPYIAYTIKRPSEIWMNQSNYGDRTLYLLAWYLVARRQTAIITTFKLQGNVWEGWSGYQSTNMNYVATKRSGRMVYAEGQK